MDKIKVVITDCDHENIDIEKKVFEEANIEIELLQCKTEDDLINQCKGIQVFINQYAPITEKIILELPDLKQVVRYGVGVNNVDLNAATNHGVQICNVPDYGMNEVADHALAIMLCLTRKIIKMNDLTKRGEWDYQRSIPLWRHSTQKVGIIGVGRIGRSFAKKVHGLGCEVVAYDPKYIQYIKDLPEYIRLVEFDELIKESDVISIHCPADNAISLIGENEFNNMKETAYLINVSRGGIIDEEALEVALREKKIAGAGVDVVAIEPIKNDSALLNYENFICTPHMAWYSEEAAMELKRKVAEEAVRFIKGELVHYPVNGIVK